MTNEYMENEDPYSSEEENPGIVGKYDRRNVTPEKIMTEDFRRVRDEAERKMKETYSIGNDTNQMIENTKSMLSRLRMGRQLDSGDEKFKRQRIQPEYMNYGKYQNNFIKREDEYDPSDNGKSNYNTLRWRELQKRTNTVNQDKIRAEEKKLIEDVNRVGAKNQPTDDKFMNDFASHYFNMNYDYRHEVTDKELDEGFGYNFNKMFAHRYHPRMSPEGKERVHLDWKNGMSIKDLSLKYGIFQERVLAIVYQREYFLKQCYPRYGETLTRMVKVFEDRYGESVGFQDYGADLHLMGAHEQGAPSMHLFRTPVDLNPPKEVKEDIEKSLASKKSKKTFEVPLKFSGKGPSGYLLKEIIKVRNPRNFMNGKVREAMRHGDKCASFGCSTLK